MLIDLRTSTFYAGKLQMFMARYLAEGLAIQTRHCGAPLGSFTSETGVLNQMVQPWAYADSADRDARLATLAADAEWQAFIAFALPMVQQQQSQLLRPVVAPPALLNP